jgi:hypothetical protein
MFRDHWREPGFWRWWWQTRASTEVRLGTYLLLFALLLGGGIFAADSLSPASAGTGRVAYAYEVTVKKTVTVREHGKLVRKIVPVIKRVYTKGKTQFRTQTFFGTQFVTEPGHVRLVRERSVKYVTTESKHVITVNGKTRTIRQTRTVPVTTIRTLTQTNLLTNEHTITDSQMVTAVVTERQVVTNTQTQTQTQTQTVVIQHDPVTVTETQTETDTLPPVTVFVTVTTTPSP